MPRKEPLSEEFKVRCTKTQLKRLNELTELCSMSRSELVLSLLKYSGGAVRKNHIKDFVKKAMEIADPFDPVFDSSDKPFEDKVLEKQLALKKELAKPGSVTGKKVETADKFSHGLSAQDITAQVDSTDLALTEEYERRFPKPTKEDLKEEREWWLESEPTEGKVN